MKKIMFNDHYGLTHAVLDGTKTMTRRISTTALHRKLEDGTMETIEPDDMFIASDGTVHFQIEGNSYRLQPPYKVGEEIAIAQRYWDLRNCDAFYEALQKADHTFPLECIRDEAGCHNKMFVRADWMPHRIRITKTKLERLQDISEEDIYKEGFEKQSVNNGWGNAAWHWETMLTYTDNVGRYKEIRSPNPQEAFACLIDKLSGYGTWERNPWVYVYEFELLR